MTELQTIMRRQWALAVVLPLLAGAGAAVIESLARHGGGCSRASGDHLIWAIAFVILALAPGAVLGVMTWRERRVAADSIGYVLPFCLALCLSVLFVFVGLATTWGGHGCVG